MVSRNGDSITFGLGIIGGIIGIISLILTCIGLILPSWYIGTNSNNTITVAQANLFSSCYAPNASQGTTSSTLTCVSYSSFQCSTSSYMNSVFNTTTDISGCTSPNSDAAIYYGFDAPIYQTSIDSYYRLRAAAILSIISVVFIFFSVVFGLITGLCTLNIYLIFLAPILACLAVIFGTCCLVIAGSVFNYTGMGFALFVSGVLLEAIVITIFGIVAGRLNGLNMKTNNSDDQNMFLERPDSHVVIRRVHKRRI